MNGIRNSLAIIGLVALIALASIYPVYDTYASRMDNFDQQAWPTFKNMAKQLMEKGSAADATVWRIKVEDDLSAEDVEMSMRSVANEYNIKNVGELPLYKQVEAMTGEKYRFAKIYMFCNALVAAKMLDYNDAYSAYLPCRVSLIEDKTGSLWIYALNMDLMIFGGKPLPPELKNEALRIKNIILEIMHRGAAGDF